MFRFEIFLGLVGSDAVGSAFPRRPFNSDLKDAFYATFSGYKIYFKHFWPKYQRAYFVQRVENGKVGTLFDLEELPDTKT